MLSPFPDQYSQIEDDSGLLNFPKFEAYLRELLQVCCLVHITLCVFIHIKLLIINFLPFEVQVRVYPEFITQVPVHGTVTPALFRKKCIMYSSRLMNK